jgi:hypothetical protein
MVTKTHFVNTVARFYDGLQPKLPLPSELSNNPLSEETLTAIKTAAATGNRFENLPFAYGEADDVLPPELRALTAQYSETTADWLDTNGVFDASRIEIATERAIELASKQKLAARLTEVSQKMTDVEIEVTARRAELLALAQDAPNRAAEETRLNNLITPLQLEYINLEENRARLEELIRATERSILNPFPSTAKKQLLTHIFERAVKNPLDKRRIIEAAEALKPILEATYSRTYRVAIQIVDVVSAIFNNPLFQLVVSVLFAYKAYALYEVAKIVIPHFISQKIAPVAVNYLINHCSLSVVHAVSLVVGAVDWVINHQIRIFVLSVLSKVLMRLSLGENHFLSRLEGKVSAVLLFPLNFSIRLIFLPLAITSRAASFSRQLTNFFARSLEAWGSMTKQAQDHIEGEKALRLWLNMAEHVAGERAKAQAAAAALAAAS